MKPARIFVADESEALARIKRALEGYDLVEVTTLLQAQRMILEDGIDLFLVGALFDDSRAMEFIKVVRTDNKHKRTPIVVVRLSANVHAAMLRSTFETMIALNNISAYLEIDDGKDASQKISSVVKQFLPADKLR